MLERTASALAMPRAVSVAVRGLFIDDVVGVDIVRLLFLLVHGRDDELLQAARRRSSARRVELGGLVALTGDDERGARLVDEDGVHLVDDGEVRGRAAPCPSL